MSWLSKVTGIGINPLGKDKIKIDPKKALMTALTVGSMGGFGPVGGVLGQIPGAAKIGAGLSKVGGLPGVGGIKGAVSKVGGFLGDHGDQLLGAGSLYEGYKANQKSNDLMNESLAIAKQGYGERAPLRSAGVTGMLNETRPDLSSVYQSANPYSKIPRRVA